MRETQVRKAKISAWEIDAERGKKIRKAHVQELARRRAEAKEKRKEEQQKKELAKLEAKRQRLLAEGAVYEAKARRKQAKREAGFQWPILPTKKVKIRKKRQGKKLSGKSRIKLI